MNEDNKTEQMGGEFLRLLKSTTQDNLLPTLDCAVRAVSKKMREAIDAHDGDVQAKLMITLEFKPAEGIEIFVKAKLGEPVVSRKLPFNDFASGEFSVMQDGTLLPYDDGQGTLVFDDMAQY